jgi:hypothetical protein
VRISPQRARPCKRVLALVAHEPVLPPGGQETFAGLITLLGEAGKDVLEGGPGKDINRLVKRGSFLIPIPSECEVKKSI